MKENVKRAIIVSVDSDIGTALAERWQSQGIGLSGTYFKETKQLANLSKQGAALFYCDLGNRASLGRAAAQLRNWGSWDALVVCAGVLNPIGLFENVDIDDWEKSVLVNFVRQVRIVRELLPSLGEINDSSPTVLWFAGGGVNSAPLNYSAYTVSKIALIKTAELLAAEMPEICFSVVGPGWVKTKIHQETVAAGLNAGSNWQLTKQKIIKNDMVPMGRVLDCIDWVVASPKSAVNGRNISAAHDDWGSSALQQSLKQNSSMYKLRRYGNDE